LAHAPAAPQQQPAPPAAPATEPEKSPYQRVFEVSAQYQKSGHLTSDIVKTSIITPLITAKQVGADPMQWSHAEADTVIAALHRYVAEQQQ
jgi:hypothetical protein